MSRREGDRTMLTHVVLFKLKDATPENVERTHRVLANMEGRIPELLEIEVGTDIVRSDRSYDLALITRFQSLEHMQAYQVHPVHKEVIEHINEVKESSIAVDFESKS